MHGIWEWNIFHFGRQTAQIIQCDSSNLRSRLDCINYRMSCVLDYL